MSKTIIMYIMRGSFWFSVIFVRIIWSWKDDADICTIHWLDFDFSPGADFRGVGGWKHVIRMGDKVRVARITCCSPQIRWYHACHIPRGSNSLSVPGGLNVQKFKTLQFRCNIFSSDILWNLNSEFYSNKLFLCSINRMHVRSQTACLLFCFSVDGMCLIVSSFST